MNKIFLISLIMFSLYDAHAGFPPMQVTAKSNSPVQEFWVTKDNGNDANDCSIFKPCKTIQAGINKANLISAYYKPTLVHVAPSFGGTGSSYVENITFSQQGVNLVCDVNIPNARSCYITGTVTVNMTGTTGTPNYVAASNESYMSGFVVVVNSASLATLNFIGTTFQRFIITNCYFDQNGSFSNTVVSNSGTSGGTPSALISYDTAFNNNNATNPTVALSAGRFWMYGTTGTIANGNAAGPSVTQSGPSSFIANIVQLTGQYLLTDNTATATFNLSTIASGTLPCIVTPSSPNTGYALLSYFGCNSTNTNSITGTGVVVGSPGNVRFGTSGDIISTVTQAVLGPGLPQGETMLGAGATTGTNVLLSILNGHIKVSQTTAPTAVVNANAGTSATCTLTNGRDSSGIINLTEGSGSWASGTQCTITFNKAYGVAPNCTFSANNAAAAAHMVSQQINITTTTTTLLVSFGAADSAATANKLMYKCEEP